MGEPEGDEQRREAWPALRRVFHPTGLTIGLMFPIEAFPGDRPTMQGQEALSVRAEALGFSALWFRDVPLRVPSFGDVGQIYDPFVYLAWIAARTSSIALATGAVILPLRHPLHTAKQAASIDHLSGGRLILGVASGDRPQEYPVFGESPSDRGEAFRDNLQVLRTSMEARFPSFYSRRYGEMDGTVDLIPKPLQGSLPIIAVGSSQQPLEWLAAHTDGWMIYPRQFQEQARQVAAWRTACARAGVSASKPVGQSLYIDLAPGARDTPTPIHLGFRAGRDFLCDHLEQLHAAGIAHVVLNLKYSCRPADEVVEELGAEVLPRVAAPSSVTPTLVPDHANHGEMV